MDSVDETRCTRDGGEVPRPFAEHWAYPVSVFLLTLIALDLAVICILLLHRGQAPVPSDAGIPLAGSAEAVRSVARRLEALSETAAKSGEAEQNLIESVATLHDEAAELRNRLAVVSERVPPAPTGRWVECRENPVFTRAGPVAFPWVIYDRNRFGAGPDGPYYKMWYDMMDDGVTELTDGDWAGLAVSNDGIRWRDLGRIREPDGAGPHRYYFHACFLYHARKFGGRGAPYRLYYPGENGITMEQSDDGLVWQHNDEPVIRYDQFPIGTYGLWVNYDDGGTPDRPGDDRFTAWVDCSGRLGVISSIDGLTWTLPPTVLFDQWQTMVITQSCSVRSTGGVTHLFYSYGDGSFVGPAPAGEGIGYIKLRTFGLPGQEVPLLPSRPVLHCLDKVPWRSQVTMCPCVVYDADSFSGHGDRAFLKMWYHGVGADNKSGIGYAFLQGPLETGEAVKP